MLLEVEEAEGGFLGLGGEGGRCCGETRDEGGEKLGMVGLSLGGEGGRGRGGGGWMVLGWVGASLFRGPLRL